MWVLIYIITLSTGDVERVDIHANKADCLASKERVEKLGAQKAECVVPGYQA